jgi:hypothetical protein
MRYRFFRSVLAGVRKVSGAFLRAVITSLIFVICVVGMLRFFGVPMPTAGELLKDIWGVSKLAKILS